MGEGKKLQEKTRREERGEQRAPFKFSLFPPSSPEGFVLARCAKGHFGEENTMLWNAG